MTPPTYTGITITTPLTAPPITLQPNVVTLTHDPAPNFSIGQSVTGIVAVN